MIRVSHRINSAESSSTHHGIIRQALPAQILFRRLCDRPLPCFNACVFAGNDCRV
jgi:hypothetical protein